MILSFKQFQSILQYIYNFYFLNDNNSERDDENNNINDNNNNCDHDNGDDIMVRRTIIKYCDIMFFYKIKN